MSTEITVLKTLKKTLGQTFKDQFGERAEAKLRKELSFIAQAMDKNAKLKSCTPQSLGNCIKSAAALELSFDPVLNHLYLVPYGSAAQLQVGYKGEIYYLSREGVILRAVVDTVCKNDTFSYQDSQSGPKWSFKKPLDGPRGNIRGSFCFYELPSGKWHGGFFNLDEIGIREKKSRNAGMWKGDFRPEMVMKTACRMARKGLPYGPALASLDDVDNQHFDLEAYELTEDREAEIKEELKAAKNVAQLNDIYHKLPKYEKTHYKVVDAFKEAKTAIKNTLEVQADE